MNQFYLFLDALCWVFVAVRELLSSCGAPAFSAVGSFVAGHLGKGSGVEAGVLSCPAACAVLAPRPEIESMTSASEGRFQLLDHHGSPACVFIDRALDKDFSFLCLLRLTWCLPHSSGSNKGRQKGPPGTVQQSKWESYQDFSLNTDILGTRQQWSANNESTCQFRRPKRPGLIRGSGRSWSRKCQLTSVLAWKVHGQRTWWAIIHGLTTSQMDRATEHAWAHLSLLSSQMGKVK